MDGKTNKSLRESAILNEEKTNGLGITLNNILSFIESSTKEMEDEDLRISNEIKK